jgi:hypothetical protein
VFLVPKVSGAPPAAVAWEWNSWGGKYPPWDADARVARTDPGAAPRSAQAIADVEAYETWTGRLAIVPVVGFYVLLVYATQYLAWNGTLGLLEQHAFLVPAPLLHP